jgi:Flp pilus assembly protein TadG
MRLRLIRDFFRRENGNVAMIVTLAMVPMLVSAGAAIDFVRAYLAKTTLQQAVDAAGLAGGADPGATSDQVLKMTEDFLKANAVGLELVEDKSKVTATVVNGIRKVDITATAEIETYFLQLIHIPKLEVRIDTRIQRSEIGGLHLALVLDATASMLQFPTTGGTRTKIESLKTAAVDLVNELMVPTSPDVSIAVVPYVGYVRVSSGANATNPNVPVPAWIAKRSRSVACSGYNPPAANCGMESCYLDGIWTVNGCMNMSSPACQWQCNNIPITYVWDGCAGLRVFAADGQTITTQHLNTLANPTSPPYPGVPRDTWHCANQQILPLTKTKTSVVNRINSISINTSSANTYLPSGLTWGWNVIAPGEPYENTEHAALLAKGGRKAMVLMTDGLNAMDYRPQSFSLHDRGYLYTITSSQLATNRAAPDALTSSLCTSIKNDGIILFTVAFDVNDPTTQALLTNCASDPGKAFSASDGNALAEAFKNIGNQLRNVRLTQ